MVQTVHTFLFADLCDYTEHSWRHGDDWSADVAVGFHELVRGLAAEESCEVVKVSGDAVMVRAADCARAVRLAHRIQSTSMSQSQLQVRIGIDTGPAVPRAGDWYGTTVNTAARIAEAAVPGELLLTERARAAADGGVAAVDRGARTLKGLPDCPVFTAVGGALDRTSHPARSEQHYALA